MLGDIFDYDRVANVTAEYRIRGKFADFVIRLDGDLKMVIEAKEFNIKLNENHLAQAVGYAANEGIEWAVLTNAHMWQLYHIRFARSITQELVFSVDLLDESIALADKVKFLYLISKRSLTEDIIGQYWAEESALNVDNILSVLILDFALITRRAVHYIGFFFMLFRYCCTS